MYIVSKYLKIDSTINYFLMTDNKRSKLDIYIFIINRYTYYNILLF